MWVRKTAILSLCLQVVIGSSAVVGLFVPHPPDEARTLRVVFALEAASQLVEFVWYAVALCRYRTIATWTRYADWVVSTPLMLVSMAMFFALRKTGRDDAALVLGDGSLWVCLAFNQLMLSLGLLAEIRSVSSDGGSRLLLGLGTAAFAVSFGFLGSMVSTADAWSAGLFSVVLVVWALYGVAAALPYDAKNVAYNCLDVVSKNCYGLFLLVYVLV